MAYASLTITTTPTQAPAGWAELEYVSGNTPYVGTDNSVTSTTGFPMTLNGVMTNQTGNQTVWLVTATGTADVRWISI